MKTKQLSVFLENKSGRLAEVTRVLRQSAINLSAMSITDNADFGILRCIVSDPQRAASVLKEAHFAVKTTDVIGLMCPNESGALSEVLDKLAAEGIFIEYLYSFNQGEVAKIVLRPSDLDACEQVLQRCNVQMLTAEQMYSL
ncbi:MAG: amino acid-binding protein [Prevotella sp.]|nr:amino acid-binding protein [Prevotella sp.]